MSSQDASFWAPLLLLATQLEAQTRSCNPGGMYDPVGTCASCFSSHVAGVTISANCSGLCQGTEECADCCWECEAMVTFPNGMTGQVAHVAEIGSSPANEDTDTTGAWMVQIDVRAACKEGAEGTSKCVDFKATYKGAPGTAKVCFRLVCDPCVGTDED